MTLTIRQALRDSNQLLKDCVDDAHTDCHVLMSFCLQKDRAWLIAHGEDEISEDTAGQFSEFIRRRRDGVPVAHITGTREFWSKSFLVTPDTLIPRPETELLIEHTLALPIAADGVKVLDYGTGSGVIAVTLASERPGWQVSAIDCSVAALNIARMNAKAHDTTIDFVEGCSLLLFSGAQFDVIVSNPPYIAEEDPHLKQGDVRFEPAMALSSGRDGLDCIRHLISNAPEYLMAKGYLVMEHGYDQGDAVRMLFQQYGYSEITTCRDLAGHDRVTSARWMGEGN